MTGKLPNNAVRLTHKTLKNTPQHRLVVEIDPGLLEQIQRILPASIAGYSEWQGRHDAPVFVRWNWYFDTALGQFVVPPHGIETNIALASEATGLPLSDMALKKFLLRRIRRRQDWHPPAPRGVARKLATPAPLAVIAAPARLAANDGTGCWAEQLVAQLDGLADEKKFAQLAKHARERFGFSHTLAVARSPSDPDQVVVEDNHPLGWQEIYQREDLVTIDPRLFGASGPMAWDAAARRMENLAFWNVAMSHGIRSGWLMRSGDGMAALVLSRPGPAMHARELALIEPNLIVLARFAHALMLRQLSKVPAVRAAMRDLALPGNDVEIIGCMKRGKHRKEIAHLLSMSIPTLDRRIKSMKEKLGASTSTEMVAAATKMGLVP